MVKIAIPVFRSRIAPVFDSCRRVFLIQIEHRRQTERTEIHLDRLSFAQRVDALTRAGVTTLICGGISDVLHTTIESSGVSVIAGKAGQVEEVLAAFISNQLDDPRFLMPGRAGKYRAPGERKGQTGR